MITGERVAGLRRDVSRMTCRHTLPFKRSSDREGFRRRWVGRRLVLFRSPRHFPTLLCKPAVRHADLMRSTDTRRISNEESSHMKSTSHEIPVEAACIHVEVLGDEGPVVLCWPGGPRPGRDLEPIGHQLVDAGFRVVLIDPRGCERSPGSTKGVSLHTLAADAATVIEHLGLAPVVALGNAFGNRVMRCLAADRPDLVSCLVLLCAGGAVPPENLDDLRMVSDASLPKQERLDALGRAYFEPGSDPTPWWKPGGPGSHEMYLTAVLPPLDEWWHGGTAPMLVIQGGRDRSAPPRNGELLAAEFADRVELITIPEAAHTLALERPAQVAALIVDHLRGLGIGGH